MLTYDFSEKAVRQLRDFWIQGSSQGNIEVGGYLDVVETRVQGAFLDFKAIDDDDVALQQPRRPNPHDHCQFSSYEACMFHTHPSTAFHDQPPPSGKDFLFFTVWGGPNNEANRGGHLHSDLDVVVVRGGFYTIQKHEQVCDAIRSLSKSERPRYYQLIEWYASVASTLLLIGHISFDTFAMTMERLDFPAMIVRFNRAENAVFREQFFADAADQQMFDFDSDTLRALSSQLPPPTTNLGRLLAGPEPIDGFVVRFQPFPKELIPAYDPPAPIGWEEVGVVGLTTGK